jgi:hypothetical protein
MRDFRNASLGMYKHGSTQVWKYDYHTILSNLPYDTITGLFGRTSIELMVPRNHTPYSIDTINPCICITENIASPKSQLGVEIRASNHVR